MAFNRLTLSEKLYQKSSPLGDCIVWTGTKNDSGYGKIRIHGKWRRAHRVSFEINHGEIPPGMVVRHSCDNPSCINPDHLLTGTQGDNINDMRDRGRARFAVGESSGKAKLTEADVRMIREIHSPGVRGRGAHVLAKRFGVSKPTIQAIISGKSWGHVK